VLVSIIGTAMASFDSLCHRLIDHWVSVDSLDTPKQLYDPILKEINIKMALSVIETTASDPYDWRFYRVKQWGYKSKVLTRLLQEMPNSALRDLNRSQIDNTVIPAYQRALDSKRPIIDMVKTELVGVRVGYERIIIPQKTDGVPEWCIGLKVGRFAIPAHGKLKADLTDDEIIQLLIEGNTAKEIAEMLKLSSRTIEHRINRMKDRLGAKNLVHLVAKLVATQVDRNLSA